MEKQKCKQCGKLIEGYSINHVYTLMAQHQIKHDNEKRNNGSTTTN